MAPSAGTSRRQLYGALGTGAVLAGALTYVGIADPHRPGFVFPACPFKAITGLDCPACGGLRMTHDLLHGDLAAAVVDNVYLLVGLPLLLTWLLIRWRQSKPLMNTPLIVVIVVSALTWTVARNLPGFPLVPTVLDG
ncbi:hypothetical protein AU184_06140 [Mycolicibacterium novocastrense]|uniref:DUF2752 domain-containing protein n=1 Tax=Mycolicibacterium novocastrense TaxID=59813 RepID=A0AAW5SJ96_MYCNV|nr:MULTISPECIES: DUF2752 domain-containing protein [Mycobacteriaceae]KUH65650.1 hypothetical protein AU072_06300 [Mycolicibacterium novocastrense]KUH65928.1 hypothetical protein AU183_15020 [Mycolicibacterium novocastrense]KUH67135.1 hypothetical protein AU184_06140 [Mycolicibacterium novocastrense]KUI47816.1 hypothetical protein AU198_22250 [Mycobacterium sp. GA-1199]MCV7023854.1 DUF2752 domain-containing protein [Mycolicibacterium novocastrense]